MFASRIGRRDAVLGALACTLAPWRAHALGRTAEGGSLAFHLPWPLSVVDPHRIDDVTAAILGESLFEPLYAVGEGGAIVPALAEADPEPTSAGLRVAVRTGVRTAHDRGIDARDVVFSIGRARSLGARGWLAEIPPPRLDGHDALVFATHDSAKLVHALASPLVAVVPTSFSPDRPDGTGPFRAEKRGDALVLSRNPRAAEGPAFLDEVVVRASVDVADSLRAFESGEDSIGWLGSGLHEPRPGARPFDFGAVAWPLLRTGREAGVWDAPGVAQRLADGIAYSRLAYLVLGAPWPAQREEGWGGAPCDLLVRDDSPWLVELARAVAATISRPAHEVSCRPIPPFDLVGRRGNRAFSLLIDAARPFASTPLGAFLGLATADDPQAVADIAKHAPRLVDGTARALTRTMHVGVLGEVRVQGAHVADVTLGATPSGGIDFGDASRARRTP